MAKINKPKLHETCSHRALLEYIKVFRASEPLPGVTLEGHEESLVDAFSKGAIPLATWVHPDFCTGGLWRLVLWVGLAVDGEEYIAALSLRNSDSLSEQHVMIDHPHGSGTVLAVGLHNTLELTYDSKADVFLPVPLERSTDIFPTMPSVKTKPH
jgi:hypothetical protein